MDSDARAAFANFYAQAYPHLVAQVTLVTGSRGLAEEVTQEAFSRAYARWDRIGRYDDPRGWIRRVALNLSISRFRTWRHTLRHGGRLLDEGTVSEPSPDWLDLRAGLMRLPIRQRRALVLLAVTGLSIEEVAAEMDVKPATVRSWLHRARNSMRVATDDPVQEAPR